MSRATMLAAIRRGLRRGPLSPDQQDMLRGRLAAHPRHIIPARTNLPRAELIELFVSNIVREFATVDRIPDIAAVPAAIADYLAHENLPSDLVISAHPEIQGLDWASRPMLRTRAGRAEPTDLVGLQQAYAAVAETGTLIMPSDPQRPTTINLLPDTELVLLREAAIVAAFEDAWDKLRSERRDGETGGFMPRNVMFVSGPSRSADVEQTLELGAHGPRRLHILLVAET